jgi:hypothetical protein
MIKTMKITAIAIVALAALASACSWDNPGRGKPAITTDTLSYQYKTLKQRADDCGTKPDSSCTVIQIKYPLFTNQPALNDSIRHHAIGLFGVYQQADTNFRQFATRFMNAYKQEMTNRNYKMNYILQTAATVARQDSSLLTIQLAGYTFQGGAHGSSLTTYINWNTKSQKHINLDDIFIPDYRHALDSIGEGIFRKEENLQPTEPLKTNYFFKGDKFSLNNNFLITPMGLRFLYNQYEIKPYAAGQTTLFIPYTQIQTLLRPNTVVSQYHK